ncbi:MAG: ABC transporter substrate-binding protein [Fusobacteriota bacterium]
MLKKVKDKFHSKKVFIIKFNTLVLIFILMIFKMSFSEDIFKEEDYIEKNGKTQLEEFRPIKKEQGKFKVALIQSDDYPEYYGVFFSILEGLKTLGWISEDTDLINREKYSTNRELINNIYKKEYSEYIEFNPKYFYSFLADEENAKTKEFKKVMELCKKGEVDLVILLGTLASKQVLKDKKYKTNTVIDAVSAPIGSGIIKSSDDSGKNFLTARIDKDQITRQVRLFHDVVDFDKLGVIYEDTENGRWYAGIDSVEKVSEERNFDLVVDNEVLAEPTKEEYGEAFKMYLDAIDRVAPKSDAIFLGISGGLETENLPNVMEKLIYDYKLPSFSMEGSHVVSKGALLGVSGKETGLYNAKKVVKILKGEKPRELEQRFEKMPRIIINLKTAKLINFNMPIDIIRTADKIYTEIEGE